MLTKAQFIQALRDTTISQDADPIATLAVLSEDASSVDFAVNAQAGGIIVTATVAVEVTVGGPKKRKAATEEDDLTVDLLEQTGFAVVNSTSMIDVEKAQQNAVRNAINLLGGMAEYIPVTAPINAVVTRPVAAPATNGNGVVAQAQAVATAAANAGGPICSDCHNPIQEVPGKFGMMSPTDYANWTTKKMGRPLCKSCNGRAYAKQQNGG